MEQNGFLLADSSSGRGGYDYVLTGYVGRAETLSGIKKAIEKMVAGGKQGRRRPLVVVDPKDPTKAYRFPTKAAADAARKAAGIP